MFSFAGWPGTLRLARIDHLPGTAREGRGRPPFTLIFAGPPGDVLPEGLYTATADGGPSFTFYIMPIHTAATDRQEYQAVFN